MLHKRDTVKNKQSQGYTNLTFFKLFFYFFGHATSETKKSMLHFGRTPEWKQTKREWRCSQLLIYIKRVWTCVSKLPVKEITWPERAGNRKRLSEQIKSKIVQKWNAGESCTPSVPFLNHWVIHTYRDAIRGQCISFRLVEAWINACAAITLHSWTTLRSFKSQEFEDLRESISS